jgi:predicted acylesterase/phospholipase RssA
MRQEYTKRCIKKYEEMIKRVKKISKPLFNIVAGTSIGAINTAISVSYMKENSKWECSDETVIDFWYKLSTKSFVDYILGFKNGGITCIHLIHSLIQVRQQEDIIP